MDSFKLKNSGNVYATFGEAEEAAEPGGSIIPQKGSGEFPLSRTAERQLCQKAGVPLDWIDKIRGDSQADLAAHVLNERLRRPTKDDPERTDRYMVRMLDNRVRAVLSDRYRIIDNMDLFFCAAEKLEQVGGEVWQMRLTENNFQLLAVSKGISGQVRTDRTFDPGDGWQSRWANLGGDTQYAAISIGNSETGGGSASVAPAVMTRVCFNFNVWAKTVRAVHIGRVQANDGLIDSAEVQAQESRLIWLKIRNAIETVFDVERFNAYIASLNDATQREIPREAVAKVIEHVADRYKIDEKRAKSIMQNLMESRDYSQYGLSQAITLEAHALDQNGSEDTAAELELVGGDLVHIKPDEWRQMAHTT